MSTTIRMPELGESVVEGTVGKWLVTEGDVVQKDQALVEILTDKADSEIPSPSAFQISSPDFRSNARIDSLSAPAGTINSCL